MKDGPNCRPNSNPDPKPCRYRYSHADPVTHLNARSIIWVWQWNFGTIIVNDQLSALEKKVSHTQLKHITFTRRSWGVKKGETEVYSACSHLPVSIICDTQQAIIKCFEKNEVNLHVAFLFMNSKDNYSYRWCSRLLLLAKLCLGRCFWFHSFLSVLLAAHLFCF